MKNRAKGKSAKEAAEWGQAIKEAIDLAPPRMDPETLAFMEKMGDMRMSTSSEIVSTGRKELGRVSQAGAAPLDLSGGKLTASQRMSTTQMMEADDDEHPQAEEVAMAIRVVRYLGQRLPQLSNQGPDE